MSLLADETVSSFEIENMQSDSESQRDREESGGEGYCVCVRVRVCVGCISFLLMPTCASDIRALHLITETDGSITRTSVCATTVYPGQVCVCVCFGAMPQCPCQDLYMCLSPFISPSPLLFAPCSYKVTVWILIILSCLIGSDSRQRRRGQT